MNIERDVGACEQTIQTADELEKGTFDSDVNGLKDRRPLRAITHFAVLAGFLLPFALVPYLVSRRQLGVLRQRMIDTETRVGGLERDVSGILSQLSTQRNEQRRLQGLIHEVVQERNGLREQIERRAAEHQTSEEDIRQGLQSLLEESQHTW